MSTGLASSHPDQPARTPSRKSPAARSVFRFLHLKSATCWWLGFSFWPQRPQTLPALHWPVLGALPCVLPCCGSLP